jgi:hypothetical protein
MRHAGIICCIVPWHIQIGTWTTQSNAHRGAQLLGHCLSHIPTQTNGECAILRRLS